MLSLPKHLAEALHKITALLNNMVLISPRGVTFSQTYITTPWLPQEAGKLASVARLKRIDIL